MNDEGSHEMGRRDFLTLAGGVLAVGSVGQGVRPLAAPVAEAPRSPQFELEEVGIADLGTGLSQGRWTGVDLVRKYSDRIRALDRTGPTLRHVLELNPEAEAIARALDLERSAGRVRGPLHGIPIVVKDNLDTGDRMMTTAGSLALEGAPAPRDSHVVERLRQAGAVILAKTNLSEWANFRSTHSSSGWSSRGGQGKNPYALDRSPCGSSSGTGGAIAASYAAAGIGTETDGSITCPSSIAALVGIKPTIGLVSRSGIVPISHSQDTAGPMARTMRDAVLVLNAIAGSDPRDSATSPADRKRAPDYAAFLVPDGLKGARLGITRKRFTGYHDGTDRLLEEALEVMRRMGAVVVDPADLPHAGEYDDAEYEVLLYEFKADLNAYLAERGDGVAVKSLADIIAFNDRERDRVMPFFGQEIMHQSEAKGPLTEPAYRKALAKCRTLSRARGIDAVMDRHRLDALVAPTGNPAWPIDVVNGDHFTGSVTTPAAVAGYPHITVPGGFVEGLPVGISFYGRAWSEPTLIRLAYSYEQATRHRKPPTYPVTAAIGAGLEGSVRL